MGFLEISVFCASYLFCLFGPSAFLDFFPIGKKVSLNERLIFSLSLFLLVASVAVHVGSMKILTGFFCLCIAFYLTVSIFKISRRSFRWDSSLTGKYQSVLTVSVLVGGYTLCFGIYGEVPADVYAHLGSIYESSRLGELNNINFSQLIPE